MRRLLISIFKPYIEEIVDKRVKEKLHERYHESKQKDLQERIARLRKSLSPPAQRIQSETKKEKEPSIILEVPRHPEPRVRKKTAKVKNDKDWYEDTMKEVEKARKKREDMDNLKKNLTAKNNWKK